VKEWMQTRRKITTTKATTTIISSTIVLSAAMVFLALLSPLLLQQEAEAAYGLLSPSDRDRVADRLEDIADRAEARGFDDLADKLRAEAAEARAGGGYE
jgi:hypothetical protein